MNGLDPGGMLDMRDMIKSLVSEGRTVVLSSHLLDKVERTCDAVAIVDRGQVIQQGPITELLKGTSLSLEIDCSEPERARSLLASTPLANEMVSTDMGLTLTLASGTSRDSVAEVSRLLVEGGIALYRFQPVQASLESWFLQVTSRFGDQP